MTKKKQVGVRFDSNRTRLKTGETQRPNGTYAYRWSTPDGKRHSIYAPTLEKLREQEEQIIVDKHDGIRSDVKSITVNEMFNLWCQLKRGIKDSTFKNYIYMYELFVKPSFGKNRLVQVKKSDVRKFYNSLADGKVLKIATIDNVHNVLHQVFQVAVDDGMIRQNPTDNMLKELKLSHGFEREKKEALTVAQQKLFFDYMLSHPKDTHWYPVFYVMANTGMRVGEITGLRWSDIDLKKGIIRVNHTLVYYNHRDEKGCYFSINTPKTKAGEREIPMTEGVKQAFLMEREFQSQAEISSKSRVDGYDDFIFVNRYGDVQNQGNLNKALRRMMRDCNDEILEKYGADSDPVLLPQFSCHILRHTFATRLIWQCKLGHEWTASVKSRTVNGTGCPYCSHNFVLPGFNDLASRFPEIAAEWSERNLPLTPDQVTAFKNIKVWWKCHLGHEWNTLISTRAGGSQCPYCSGIKLLKGFNDLKTKYPSLAAEWSEKNLSLTPDAVNEKSTKNVWWKCNTCGYEWKAVVKARVKGGMCPVCAERAVLQGYNDLGTTDPYLLSEWDYEKNSKWTPSNVSRNSMKVVWWKCGAGHSYRAKITDRTIEQKGCPQCEAEFQQTLPQMLIMMYGAQNGITVKSNSDSELGMRLVAYLPELHCAVDIAGATVTEKREQSVKAHICQSNRLGYYLIKRTADASQMAAEIKTLFIRNHIYLHTDSEKDVQVLRERFLEWKYRNACKLNGKY